jgi:hypothetical protein
MKNSKKATDYVRHLKDLGLSVTIRHRRYLVGTERAFASSKNLVVKRQGDGQDVTSRGGVCEVEVVPHPKYKNDNTPNVNVFSRVVCHSADNYSKRIGYVRAIGAIRRQLEEEPVFNTIAQ